MVRFGTAGNSKSFYDQGFKHTYQAPDWLRAMGLDAFEFSAGHGVQVKEAGARKIGDAAALCGIAMSVHAPYFINLADARPEKRENNLRWLHESSEVVRWMGGDRVVFHPGAVQGGDRVCAQKTAMEELRFIRTELDERGFSDITLCPETLGKKQQLGTLDEVLEMCCAADNLLPCLDFGHLHVRDLAAIQAEEDVERMIARCEEVLGERVKAAQVHFSHIEYGPSGEKRHKNFEDEGYGPDFTLFPAQMIRRRWEPRFICESANMQAEDALAMKNLWEAAR